MKKAKLFLLLPLAAPLLGACSFEDVKNWFSSIFNPPKQEEQKPEEEEPKDEEKETTEEGDVYTVKLTADNSTLTTEDSSENIVVELPSEEDETVKYSFEITPPCYLNTKSSVANQICVKTGAMIRSVSEYTVKKITVDFFGGKGVNYEVFNNTEHTGDAITYEETSVTPMDPDDGGLVYDYTINSTGWSIYNSSSYKPTFYYILVTFTK